MGAKIVLYHVIALVFFAFISYRVQVNKKISTDPTVRNMQKYSLRFLTNWTFTVQMVYFGLCVLQHIISLISTRLGNKVNGITNFIAISIAAPMSLVVSVAFWGIYLVDRELVFPKALDEVLPPFINHSIHTMNALFSLGDLFLVKHRYPQSIASLLKPLIIYLLLYSGCLFGTYAYEGVWLYPFLNKLTWPQIAGASVAVLAISITSLFITKLLHYLVHGASTESSKKHSKKRK